MVPSFALALSGWRHCYFTTGFFLNDNQTHLSSSRDLVGQWCCSAFNVCALLLHTAIYYCDDIPLLTQYE
jgi:hypothetical protein